MPIGGALISPLLAIGVASVGWRWAAFASGCIFLLVCLPLSFQLKRSPESMGLLPDGDVAPADFGEVILRRMRRRTRTQPPTSRAARP